MMRGGRRKPPSSPAASSSASSQQVKEEEPSSAPLLLPPTPDPYTSFIVHGPVVPRDQAFITHPPLYTHLGPPPALRNTIQNNCGPCKKAKARCEKLQPCNRCIREGIQCYGGGGTRSQPQTTEAGETPKGPLSLSATSSSSTESATSTTSLSTTTTTSATSTSSSQHDDGDKPPLDSHVNIPQMLVKLPAMVRVGPIDGQHTFVPLAVTRPPVTVRDPSLALYQQAAHTMSLAFIRIHREGQVDKRRAMDILASWKRCNAFYGVDATMGLYSKVLQTLEEATPDDNSSPSPTPHPTNAGGSQSKGGSDFVTEWLSEYNDPLTSITGFIHLNNTGELEVFTNQRFSRTFMTMDELEHKIRHYRLLPTILWASVLSVGDLTSFYQQLTRFLFSGPGQVIPQEMSRIAKCHDKLGNKALSLFRVRQVMNPMDPTSHSLVLVIFPLPQSRYFIKASASTPPRHRSKAARTTTTTNGAVRRRAPVAVPPPPGQPTEHVLAHPPPPYNNHASNPDPCAFFIGPAISLEQETDDTGTTLPSKQSTAPSNREMSDGKDGGSTPSQQPDATSSSPTWYHYLFPPTFDTADGEIALPEPAIATTTLPSQATVMHSAWTRTPTTTTGGTSASLQPRNTVDYNLSAAKSRPSKAAQHPPTMPPLSNPPPQPPALSQLSSSSLRREHDTTMIPPAQPPYAPPSSLPRWQTTTATSSSQQQSYAMDPPPPRSPHPPSKRHLEQGED